MHFRQTIAARFRIPDYHLEPSRFAVLHAVRFGRQSWCCVVAPEDGNAWYEWAIYDGADDTFTHSNAGYGCAASALLAGLKVAEAAGLL